MLGAQSPTKIVDSRLPVAYSASEIKIETSVPPRSSDVDSLAPVHELPPHICGLGLYPVAERVNRECVATKPTLRSKFAESPFHTLG